MRVAIEALDAKTTYNEQYTYEKSGLTIALTGTAADMYEAAKAVERAKEKGNDKLLALQSIKSALTALEAIEDLQLQNQQGQKQASIGVSVMVGTQRTEREVNQEQHNVISSTRLSISNEITRFLAFKTYTHYKIQLCFLALLCRLDCRKVPIEK